MFRSEKMINVYSSLMAILSGLIFGLIIMFMTNSSEAFPAFWTILVGGFSSGLNEVLFLATPLILTGLSVGFAFKTGLFNIGAAGQLMVGAVVAILVGVNFTFLPGYLLLIVAILASGLAGALWGYLPGILKAYRNVNEVVSTIMMNYIGLYLVNYIVKYIIWDQVKSQSMSVGHYATIPYVKFNLFGLDMTFYTGILVAIIAVIIIHIILSKTTLGYQLKAVGSNKYASRYAGINEKKNIVISMLIAGFLAGLAGGVIFLVGATGRHLEPVEVLVPEGFLGIPVALIGLSNPIGILFAGLFMGYIEISGWNLQLFNFANEIIDIIISSIIYFSALVILFRGIINRLNRGGKNG